MRHFKQHFLYWILPSAITLVCILIYFFNFFNASAFIASPSDREFGLLEHLQLLPIIIIAVIAGKTISVKKNILEKFGFICLALVATWLFFEEIDYGLHYYDYLTNNTEKVTIRNVHNNGNLTSILKMTSYAVIVLFFVVLPLIPKAIKNKYPLVGYLVPSKLVLACAICLFLLNQYVLFLDKQDFHSNRGLEGNISEFEELMTYYTIMLYVFELSNPARKLPIQLRKDWSMAA